MRLFGRRSVTSAEIPNGSIANEDLATMAALTVKANPTASSATPQDLAAASNDTLLVRASNALSFAKLSNNMVDENTLSLGKLINASAEYNLIGRTSSGAGAWEQKATSADVWALLGCANDAAFRTELGLGTAATQNTGTSGANVPLLNGINTWSAAQSIAVVNQIPLTLQYNDAGAGTGPLLLVYRNSASPAASDVIGGIRWQGKDSAANDTIYAAMQAQIVDPVYGSEDGRFVVSTIQAGAFTTNANFHLGLHMNAATGGDQGAGTVNAVDYFDDGVILCAPFHPEMSQEDWDEITVTANTEEYTYTKIVNERHETTLEKALRWATLGAYKAKVESRKVKVKGVRNVDEFGRGKHITAKRHFRMLEQGFEPGSPESYIAWMEEHKSVPAMPSLDEWRARMLDDGVQDKISSSERFERIMLALDYIALAYKGEVEARKSLEERIVALEAQLAAK